MYRPWVIARREYRATVQTKSFVIAVVLMPVMMGGGIGVQMLMEGRVDIGDRRIAVLDLSGRTFEALRQAVERRNRTDILDPATQRRTDSAYLLEEVPAAGGDLDAQLLTLSDRVRRRELFAFVVIPEDVFEQRPAGAAGTGNVRYFSNQPTYDNIRRWLSRGVTDEVVSVRLAQAGIDREVLSRALAPVSVESLGLVERDQAGNITRAEHVNKGLAFGVPFGMVMLMFMGITITAGPLLNSVLEEKMHRIAEVLLGSVPPFELMLGKLIGYIGVAMTLISVYLGGGYLLLRHYGFAGAIPIPLILWFVVFEALAVLMFGSVFLALGACCNDVKEAQSLMMPVWLVLCVPMLALSVVLQHPHSTFSLVLSLFPPATPMLMTMRMAMPPGVPAWEPAAGILGVLLSTAICVWAAGRIFRVGLLMQGKPPRLADIARWVRRG